jgi:hypothetical protein
LAGGEAVAFVAAALEQKIAGTLPARRKVLVSRLARLLSNLKPDRPTGFALPNGGTVDRITMGRDVLDLEAHQVAATQLAINRQIEERQVSLAPCELQPCPNRPNVLRLQRWFRSDPLGLVPGFAWGRDAAGPIDGLHRPSPILFGEGRACSGAQTVAQVSLVSERSGDDALGGGLD